jgi:hypothetical protein
VKNKVYVLGAGVNKILHYVGNNTCYSAPINNDFFKILFGIDFDRSVLTRIYDDSCKPLRDYIFENWRKNKQDLITDGLNLEELYTKIQVHRIVAKNKGNDEKLEKLNYVYTSINRLFYEVLNLFKWSPYNSDAFLKFGKLLYKEQPTIITFNYDNFVERSIEAASGEVKNSDPFGFRWNWNKALAYGIKFDEIVYDNKKQKNIKLSSEEFYSNNKLYDWSILKLHGSVNWWEYTEHSPYSSLYSNQTLHKTYSDKKDKILLQDMNTVPQFPFITHDQLTINPIIVAPLKRKTFYSHNNTISEKFNILWNKAEEALKICDSLVVVGYSFPEADERAMDLFRNSFSNNKTLKEILVVNPNKDVKERVKNLCPDKYVTQVKSLEVYLKNFPSM